LLRNLLFHPVVGKRESTHLTDIQQEHRLGNNEITIEHFAL